MKEIKYERGKIQTAEFSFPFPINFAVAVESAKGFFVFPFCVAEVLEVAVEGTGFKVVVVVVVVVVVQRLVSQICDPDKVFTVDDRIIIEEKLKCLENKTSKNGSRNCDGMGLFAVTIIGKHFKGGNSDSLKAIANDLISKWSSNNYCKKLIIIAFASDDRKVWITGDSGVQIECKKYTDIFEDQKSLFQKGNFTQAILNIIDALESAKNGSKGLSTYAIAGIIIGIGLALFLCALCCKHFCPGDGSSTTSGNGDYGYGGGDGGGGGDCGGGGGF